MAARRSNPNVVKLHRTYSVPELAACFGVHKNTVRLWQRDGLMPLDGKRPVLFHGAMIRAFLSKRNVSRKTPCPSGTLYCFKCRAPRLPALGMIDYMPFNAVSGNLWAICGTCETVMHRRAREADLASTMPGCDFQFVRAPSRLKGCSAPSLNCDLERQATT